MLETQPAHQPETPERRGLTFWLWIALGAVLLLLVTPFVIGAFLPDVYVGSARAEFALAREELWSAIQDYERHPLSAGLAREVRGLAGREGQPAWIEEQRTRTLIVTTLESDAPSRVVRQVDDAGSALSCEWEIAIEELGGRSSVTVVQRCEIRGGGLGAPYLRFIMRFLEGAAMGPRSYLRRLSELPGASVGAD